MNALTDSQREDVGALLAVCRQFDADAVVIGATAYRLLIDDPGRLTLDIDLALALDVDDFMRLEDVLAGHGWRQSPRLEHRWTTPRDNRFDLLPAGPGLRKEQRLVWPRSGFVMSLAGFDHVFRSAVLHDLGGGLLAKVVPPAVLALLKITSYLENPVLRAKDLDDLKSLLRWYEHDSPRVFSDPVLDAELPDIEFASAFLLGSDVAAIADASDRTRVLAFVERMRASVADVPEREITSDDWTTRESLRLREQLAAFLKAFQI